MNNINGSCLCGNVQYSTLAEPLMTAVCHCSDCQKQSGSAFSVNVLVPAEGFEVSGPGLSSYASNGGSGLPVQRFFCSTCGSALYSAVTTLPGLFVLKAGSLSDPSAFKPAVHLWCASAQPWVEIDRSLACYEQAPSE
ncbi:GFA family protein [Pseudomonas vancouverensis]|uniref:GFA family protein n=1 Tax=Pseudomonas vancouverensis TaxID=95300 RepID=UPI003CFE6B02